MSDQWLHVSTTPDTITVEHRGLDKVYLTLLIFIKNTPLERWERRLPLRPGRFQPIPVRALEGGILCYSDRATGGGLVGLYDSRPTIELSSPKDEAGVPGEAADVQAPATTGYCEPGSSEPQSVQQASDAAPVAVDAPQADPSNNPASGGVVCAGPDDRDDRE